MTDDAIAGRILKFMRQMNTDDTDDALVEAAVARNWLDVHGRPTRDGRQLVKGFNDLETLARQRA